MYTRVCELAAEFSAAGVLFGSDELKDSRCDVYKRLYAGPDFLLFRTECYEGDRVARVAALIHGLYVAVIGSNQKRYACSLGETYKRRKKRVVFPEDYDVEDERQQCYLSEITKYNVTKIG